MDRAQKLELLKTRLIDQMHKQGLTDEQVREQWAVTERVIQNILENPEMYDRDESQRQQFRAHLADQGIEVTPAEMQQWFEGRKLLADLCRKLGLV